MVDSPSSEWRFESLAAKGAIRKLGCPDAIVRRRPRRNMNEMISDAALVEGFERGSLEQFHHADHVHLSIVYLARYGRDQALERLTAGIRRLAAADGHPEKFHVTMTRAWLDLVYVARAAPPHASDPAALVAACPELLDKSALERCYS